MTLQEINNILWNFSNDNFKSSINEFYEETKKDKDFVDDTFSDKAEEWFIDDLRIKETPNAKKYRTLLYSSLGNSVRGYKSRIERAVKSIRNTSDYGLSFSENSTRISTDFKEYLTKRYPIFGSFEAWFWQVLPDMLISDSNGVMYALPTQNGIREFNSSQIFFCKSENVIEYKSGTSCILLSDKKSDIIDENGILQKGAGNIIIFLTDTGYTIATQIKTENALDKKLGFLNTYEILGLKDGYDIGGNPTQEIELIPHNCGMMPALKVGFYIEKVLEDGQILCKSLIADSIPNLRRAIFNAFDLDVELIYHSATEEWRSATTKCTSCNGTGKNPLEAGKACSNKKCNNGWLIPEMTTGNGLEVSIIANPPMKDSNLPSSDVSGKIQAIGGFIQRNTEAVRIFSEQLEKNVQQAFMWSSMEYIFRNNSVQSGEFKKLDKEDAEVFLITLSQHLCGNLEQNCIDWLYKMRYVGTNEVNPATVKIPTRFSLETSQELYDKLEKASKDGVDPVIVNMMEQEYVAKEWGESSIAYKRIYLANIIDPMTGKSDLGRALGKPTMQWWENVLSEQVTHFIQMAEMEHTNFYDLKIERQIEIIHDYAKIEGSLTEENQDRVYQIKEQVQTRNIK